MVKRVSRPFYSTQPKKRRKWWRGFIGALLTALLVVPYMMGRDLEKYLNHWLAVSNQEQTSFHWELQHYQRHYLSSEGDLLISGKPLAQPLQIHLKVYHGPLCLKAPGFFRFGLGFIEGELDPKSFLGQQDVIKLDKPIQLTAFIPYFSDRELNASFPPFMISDRANNLVYHFLALQGSLDSDGLLELELPTLEVNYLDGNKAAQINSGVLRVQARSGLGSFSVKQLEIYRSPKDKTTIANFVMQTKSENLSSGQGQADLALNLHFDQLQGVFGADELMDLGPFETQLNIHGLEAKGFSKVIEGFKLLGVQGGDLTVQQGENLERAWTSLLAATTVFDLNSKLSTSNGALEAEFKGGFKPEKPETLPADAFYTKGSIRLSPELREVLSKMVGSLAKDKPGDSEITPLTLLLDLMKQDNEGYVTTVDVREGRVLFNGKGIQQDTNNPSTPPA